VYLLLFLIKNKIKTKYIRIVQRILWILLWFFIATVIVLIVLMVASLIHNQSIAETYRELRIAIIIILALVLGIGMYLPQIVLLYIIQQSFDHEFYEAFIKTNPRYTVHKIKDTSE